MQAPATYECSRYPDNVFPIRLNSIQQIMVVMQHLCSDGLVEVMKRESVVNNIIRLRLTAEMGMLWLS